MMNIDKKDGKPLTLEEFESSFQPLNEINEENEFSEIEDNTFLLTEESEIHFLIKCFKNEVESLNEFIADEEFKNSCPPSGEEEAFQDDDGNSPFNLCNCEAQLIIKYFKYLISRLHYALD